MKNLCHKSKQYPKGLTIKKSHIKSSSKPTQITLLNCNIKGRTCLKKKYRWKTSSSKEKRKLKKPGGKSKKK